MQNLSDYFGAELLEDKPGRREEDGGVFRKERESFKFNGGDLENFVHFSKLAFAKNKIFKVGVELEMVIQMEDILGAFELFGANKNREVKEANTVPMYMYT